MRSSPLRAVLAAAVLVVVLLAGLPVGPLGLIATAADVAPEPTSAERSSGSPWLRPASAVRAAPDAVWIDAVHQHFLGRAATAEEVRAFLPVVAVDGRATVTERLAASSEWAGREIDELYRRALGRAPEPGGRAHWLDVVAGGTPFHVVITSVHGSAEYRARAGGTDAALVDALYGHLLGRRADDAGRDFWISALAEGRIDDAGVAAALADSVESRGRRVDATFEAVLGRRADDAGRSYWVDALAGVGTVRLAAFLAASDEHHANVTGVSGPRIEHAGVGAGTAYPLASSWRPGCPVGPEQLVAVEFDHWRFDGSRARGVLIVHRDAVGATEAIVRALHGAGVPLHSARPVDDFGGDDDASMAAGNSSAFNCRVVAGTDTWSRHAFGTAIDLDPIENPHVRDGRVDPPAGADYLDRADVRPGMLVEGGPVVATIDRLGWGWGGRWRSALDYQHVSQDGR